MEVKHILFCLIFVRKICANSIKCPNTYLPNGKLYSSCQRNPDEICLFYCDFGYTAVTSENSNLNSVDISTDLSYPNMNTIKCTLNSTWEKSFSELCQKVRCPDTIPHGTISTICGREYDDVCGNYSCENGYNKSMPWNSLKCNAYGDWKWTGAISFLDFCVSESQLCPKAFPDGKISRWCLGYEGYNCSYQCDFGCRKNPEINALQCRNGKWNVDNGLLCRDCLRCSDKIPNGLVIVGGRYADMHFDYECHLGYEKNKHIASLNCSKDNKWITSMPLPEFSDVGDFCIPNKCPTVIPNGTISPLCSREPFSRCDYHCDSRCLKDQSRLYCNGYGQWGYAESACNCLSGIRCPYNIQYGYIYGTCDFTPGSICIVRCYSNCRVVVPTLKCEKSGNWDLDSFSCNCEASTTETPEVADTKNIGVFGIAGIMFAVCFLITVLVVVGRFYFIRPVNRNDPPRNSQQFHQISSTSTLNDNNRVDLPEYQFSASNIRPENTGISQGSPSYNEISFIKPQTPEPPPSYEEVANYPLSFVEYSHPAAH